MKLKWWIICGIGGICLAVISCQGPNAPEFREIENFNISSLRFTGATVNGEAVFYNPNMDIMLEDLAIKQGH